LPHVHLVDTAPRGVGEINERGVVHEGVEYPLDVLIYATGFQWMGTSTFNRIRGRNGRTLTEKWETEGTRTFLGRHTSGFPNLFIVTGPQGGGGGRGWDKFRVEAQSSLDPYVFGGDPN
jgi:cation diffusion facilitator CzcD-associated flavoprotein CzcO